VTKISGDANLISSNILSGKTIFGVAGSLTAGYTYGDTTQANVLTIAAGAGTYNASNLSVGNVRSGTTFGVGLTGTMYGDTDASKVCSNATAAGTLSVAAANIATGNTYCGTAGTAILSLGDAVAGNVLAGKHFSNSTTSNVLGTMTDNTGHADFTPAVTSVAIPTGFYDGVTKISGDANLISSNILSGKTIFGVAGSIYGDTNQAYVLGTAAKPGIALKNLWNGTCSNTLTCPLGTEYPGGAQNAGGVDDFNDGGTALADRYAMGWTQCTAGPGDPCGVNLAASAYKDNSTGLIWSKTMDTAANSYALDGANSQAITWYQANNCIGTFSTCVKPHSPATGCEANAGWEVPTQKQLMQAYIDGSYGNLDVGVIRYYWSATTDSNSTTSAWYVSLSYGSTNNNTKTNPLYVRCVR
jgi:hypothetical protein